MFIATLPKVSVIIPSFNQGAFFERTLLSIIAQDYPNLEVLVIDGGSTDNTLDIILKYDHFIDYWISEKDRGQAHALNKGLDLATGEFVGWMNSDDIYLKDAFYQFANAYSTNPGCDIFYANKIVIDEYDHLLRKVIYARPSKGFMKFYSRYAGMTFCNQAAFIRKDILHEVGRFDERFHVGMDLDLFFRLIKAGKKFHYTNAFWGAWRYHSGAKTANDFNDSPRRKNERELFKLKHHIYRGFGCSVLRLAAFLWRRVLLYIAT